MENNLFINSISKFKEDLIEIRFLSELVPYRTTVRFLLSLMLQDRTQKYSTKIKMNQAIDDLYGASFRISNMGYGKNSVLSIQLKSINEKYADKGHLRKRIQFLNEVIYHPLFSDEVFTEAKKDLYDHIQRIVENPGRYALRQALSVAGEGYPLSIFHEGSLEDLETITLQDVIDEYQRMLKDDYISIHFIGDEKEDNVRRYLNQYLPLQNQKVLLPSTYLLHSNEEKNISENKDLEQTNVVVVYNTNCNIESEDYWPLKVGCALLGQLPISLLFQHVREQKSLCYDISSSIITFDGVLIIRTSIDYQNIEEVLLMIDKEMEDVKAGNYDEMLIDMAIKMLENSYISSEDYNSMLLNLSYQNLLLNRNETIYDFIDSIRKITKKDISDVFQKIQKNTTYIVGKDTQDEESN